MSEGRTSVRGSLEQQHKSRDKILSSNSSSFRIMGRAKGQRKGTKDVASSSTNQTPITTPPRFKTPEVYGRYLRDMEQKPVPERGIDIKDDIENKYERYLDQLTTLQWKDFIKPPEKANIHVVREFYANLPESTIDEVVVRNHTVKYDAETINALFKLSNEDGPHDFLSEEERPTRTEQVHTICGPNFMFDEDIPVYKQVAPITLTFECRIWMWFICSNLFPTQSGREMTIERLWALYCIVNGFRINVGRVINKAIRLAANDSPAHIFFPNLIARLCFDAGVRKRVGDLFINPKAVIDQKHVYKHCTNKHAHNATRAQPQIRQPQEPNPDDEERNVPPTRPENQNEQLPPWFVDYTRHNNERLNEIQATIQNGPPPHWFVDYVRHNKECYEEIKAMIQKEPPPPVTPWMYDTQSAYYPRFDDEQPNVNQANEAIDPANFTFDPNTIPGFGDEFDFGGPSGANNNNDEE